MKTLLCAAALAAAAGPAAANVVQLPLQAASTPAMALYQAWPGRSGEVSFYEAAALSRLDLSAFPALEGLPDVAALPAPARAQLAQTLFASEGPWPAAQQAARTDIRAQFAEAARFAQSYAQPPAGAPRDPSAQRAAEEARLILTAYPQLYGDWLADQAESGSEALARLGGPAADVGRLLARAGSLFGPLGLEAEARTSGDGVLAPAARSGVVPAELALGRTIGEAPAPVTVASLRAEAGRILQSLEPMGETERALLQSAVEVAFAAHGEDFRKFGLHVQMPYLRHVLGTVKTLINDFGVRDPRAVAVMFLHDVQEDHLDVWEAVSGRFDDRIRKGVSLLTKGPDTGAYLRRLVAEGSREDLAAKLSDRINNLRGIRHGLEEHLGSPTRTEVLAFARKKFAETEDLILPAVLSAGRLTQADRRVFFRAMLAEIERIQVMPGAEFLDGFKARLTELLSRPLERARIDALTASADFSPPALIAELKKDPFLRAQFGEQVGLWEKFSLESHTGMMMTQFERYFPRARFPAPLNRGLFRLMLAFHDIGKAQAIAAGDKHLQHEFTARIMRETLGELGYAEEELRLLIGIVNGDPIGPYVNPASPNPRRDVTPPTLETTIARVEEMARAAGMRAEDFFPLLLMFYMSDSGAYSNDATAGLYGPAGFYANDGSQKLYSLDGLFVFDRPHGTVSFAPAAARRMEPLLRHFGL